MALLVKLLPICLGLPPSRRLLGAPPRAVSHAARACRPPVAHPARPLMLIEFRSARTFSTQTKSKTHLRSHRPNRLDGSHFYGLLPSLAVQRQTEIGTDTLPSTSASILSPSQVPAGGSPRPRSSGGQPSPTPGPTHHRDPVPSVRKEAALSCRKGRVSARSGLWNELSVRLGHLASLL